MTLTKKDTISTRPTTGSPTVTGEWVRHDFSLPEIRVDVTCDKEGILSMQWSNDGSTVVETTYYDIAKNFWSRNIDHKHVYARMQFTLTAGTNPITFSSVLWHSDENNVNEDEVNSLMIGRDGANSHVVSVSSTGVLNVFDSTANVNLSNLDIPLSTVNTSLTSVSNLDIALSTVNTSLTNVSNLDIPLSTVNTSLADVSNLDIPLSTVNTTLSGNLTVHAYGNDGSDWRPLSTNPSGLLNVVPEQGNPSDLNVAVHGSDDGGVTFYNLRVNSSGDVYVHDREMTNLAYIDVRDTGTASAVGSGTYNVVGVQVASITAGKFAIGLYNQSAAPTSSDSANIVCQFFGGPGDQVFSFTNDKYVFTEGIAVRAVAGSYDLSGGGAVSAGSIAASISYY